MKFGMDTSKLPDGQSFGSFMEGGCAIEGSVVSASSSVREQAKNGYKQEWLDARLWLMSITAKLLVAKNGVAGDTNAERSHRILLLMSFVQGATVTESLISEGQYVKAAAVLKQDYEVLTRLNEVKAGVNTKGQTPQVKNAPAGSQHFYGELNKIAHPSNPDLIAQLLGSHQVGNAIGPSYLPRYLPATANGMYELHVWMLLEVTRNLLLLFAEWYGAKDPVVQEAVKEFLFPIGLLEQVGFVVRTK